MINHPSTQSGSDQEAVIAHSNEAIGAVSKSFIKTQPHRLFMLTYLRLKELCNPDSVSNLDS